MPKKKCKKYQRVKFLPNVIVAEEDLSRSPESYPWYNNRYAGMKKVLEVGCGKGEHSLALAAESSETLCVGVDRKSHRLCVGAEAALEKRLDNVQFLRAEVEWLGSFFCEQSIDEMWLTFPDPHLKHRQSKARLTAPRFLDTYAKLLTPGGRVHLKTDSLPFFQYTRKSVIQWGGRIVEEFHDLHKMGTGSVGAHAVVSAFEHAARSRGESIKYLAFEFTRLRKE